jgi:hypothetical protein
MGGGPRSLAGAALLVAVGAASCGTSTQGPPASGGTFSGDGGNALTGPQAFSVQSALVSTAEALGGCGYNSILPDGSYAVIGVVLTDMDIKSTFCTDASVAQVDALRSALIGHPFLVIQMKTVGYPRSGNLVDAGPLAPIVPGTYGIDFENLPDDDLCMAMGGLALIDIRDWGPVDGGGASTVASATTGTLTLTTVAPGHIAGHFDVKMAAYSAATDTFDTVNTTALSASFDATSCNGM